MSMSTLRNLLKVMPDWLALRFIRAVASRSQRPAISPTQQGALSQAMPIRYGHANSKVAWSWAWGRGPLIVLVHGWNGRAAQMAPLAVELAKRGYRCIAIEVTGHGSSPGKRTGWSCFIEDIGALQRSLGGEVYAFVGHSAGALTMMAARIVEGTVASRYICICAPSHPYPPINVIRQKLNPKQGVIARYREYIAREFGWTWEQLQAGAAYAGLGSDLLLFYDETDRFVSHEEGTIIEGWCPGATLVKTNEYSHGRILEAPELTAAVIKFMRGSADS